jgi:hypothetical protein
VANSSEKVFWCLAEFLRPLTAITPSGLFVYRSKLFGGMSAEVLTIFNKSELMAKLKDKQIPASLGSFIF